MSEVYDGDQNDPTNQIFGMNYTRLRRVSWILGHTDAGSGGGALKSLLVAAVGEEGAGFAPGLLALVPRAALAEARLPGAAIVRTVGTEILDLILRLCCLRLLFGAAASLSFLENL